MTQSSRDKCPPVDDAPVQKEALSHAGAEARARTRAEFNSVPIARIQLKRVPADQVFYHRVPNPAAENSEPICCKVLKNRGDERPTDDEPEPTERERKRLSMVPFPPGSRVRFVHRSISSSQAEGASDLIRHYVLDKVTLWKRPGPHARQINLWWRDKRDEQWYKDMRRQELHSVQRVGTQATVVSFLVCPDTGQRWVALLLDGGRGLGWCYAIDALELV